MTNMSLYKSTAGEQSVLANYETALRGWAVPFTTYTVPTRCGSTFVIDSGDAAAPPLVALHGAGGNSTIWAGDIEPLCRRYRVYAVDLIGEAGQSAPSRPAWEGAAFAEWLEDVLDGLHLGQAVLMGISQGGWAALKFAVCAPERVEKLVLIAPGGVVPDRPTFLLKALSMILLGKWGAKRLVRQMFGDQSVPDEVVEVVVQIMTTFKPRVGTLPIFSDAELRALTMPVLLVGGTKDIVRDVDKIAARLGDLLPGLTVKRLPGAGHAVLQTAPYLVDFLSL